jgi:hypothetical protein
MSQTPEPGRLSKLEWFGLISGLIGLVADGITLLTLFSNVQNTHISLAPSFNVTSFNLWLISFFGVAYTVLIVSYYIRRILMRRYMRYRKRVSVSEVSQKRREETKRAISVITALIGVPLFLLHFLLLFYIIREQIVGLDPEHLDRLMGERDATDAMQLIGGVWLFISPLIAYAMTMIMETFASSIYTALKK